MNFLIEVKIANFSCFFKNIMEIYYGSKNIESVMGAGDALSGLFIYAIVVTIIAVVVTILLARVAAKMGVEIEE